MFILDNSRVSDTRKILFSTVNKQGKGTPTLGESAETLAAQFRLEQNNLVLLVMRKLIPGNLFHIPTNGGAVGFGKLERMAFYFQEAGEH